MAAPQRRKHLTLLDVPCPSTILLLLLPFFGLTSGLQQQSPSSNACARRSILFQQQSTSCLSSAAVADDFDDDTQYAYDWDEQFQKLQSFKAKHGHCNFPQNPSKQLKRYYPTLKRFCYDQRIEYTLLQKKKRISQRMSLPMFDRSVRIRRLEEIGFDCNLVSSNWYDNYNEVLQYRSAKGDFMVKPDDPLYFWMQRQRRRRNTALTDEQLRLLNEIEFPWESARHDSKWSAMYDELQQFQREHGHCQPDRSTHGKLHYWCDYQQVKHQKGRLSTEKIDLLNKIDFPLEHKIKEWPKMYRKLTEYYNAHGHLQVNKDDEDETDLYDWMTIQRKRYHGVVNPALSDGQIEKLEELHFCWSLDWKDRIWHGHYTEVAEFFKEHGHVRMIKKKNRTLYNWIQIQGKRYKEQKGQKPLSEEELEMLEQIDFPFLEGQPRLAWNTMYSKVTRFREENDGSFPTCHEDDPVLNHWMRQQRLRYRCSYGYVALSDEQKSLLESVDFPMYPKATESRTWYQKYDELVDFWKQHGNFVLDRREHAVLYRWAKTQRMRFGYLSTRAAPLSKLQLYLMERIGFPWTSNRREIVWQQNYDEVLKFLEVQGHLPTKASNPKLTNWVYRQRQKYENDVVASRKLSKYEIEQLEKIKLLMPTNTT